MAIFDIFKRKPAASAKHKQVSPQRPKKSADKEISPKIEPIKKAPLRKKLATSYKLLKSPHISEKATLLSEQGKYIFRVFPDANKSEIKKAIESHYGVAVEEINIINIKTKERLLRGHKGKKTGYKKAIVTLAKGHAIEILPH